LLNGIQRAASWAVRGHIFKTRPVATRSCTMMNDLCGITCSWIAATTTACGMSSFKCSAISWVCQPLLSFVGITTRSSVTQPISRAFIKLFLSFISRGDEDCPRRNSPKTLQASRRLWMAAKPGMDPRHLGQRIPLHPGSHSKIMSLMSVSRPWLRQTVFILFQDPLSSIQAVPPRESFRPLIWKATIS
jgi:hypothetical protein